MMQKPELPQFELSAAAVSWANRARDVALASSEVIRMVRRRSTSASTHAEADVDAINAAEERGLPEANTIVAQDSQFARRGR